MIGVCCRRMLANAALLGFLTLMSACGNVNRIELSNGDRFCVPKRLAPPRDLNAPVDTDEVLGFTFLACERHDGPGGRVCVLPEGVISANFNIGDAVGRTRWGDIRGSAAMQSLVNGAGTVVWSDEGRRVTYVEQPAVGVDEVFVFYGAAVGSLEKMPDEAELALVCDRGPVEGGQLPRASECRRFMRHGQFGIDYGFEPKGDVVSQLETLDGAVVRRVESFKCQ